jgi:hypothetical protein
MDVSTARPRTTGVGRIAPGALLLLASCLWFAWVSSSWAHDWLERHAPVIYNRFHCNDYQPLFFIVGGGLCIAGAVLGWTAFRRTAWGGRWLGFVVGVVGIVAALAWASGLAVLVFVTRCSD